MSPVRGYAQFFQPELNSLPFYNDGGVRVNVYYETQIIVTSFPRPSSWTETGTETTRLAATTGDAD